MVYNGVDFWAAKNELIQEESESEKIISDNIEVISDEKKEEIEQKDRKELAELREKIKGSEKEEDKIIKKV